MEDPLSPYKYFCHSWDMIVSDRRTTDGTIRCNFPTTSLALTPWHFDNDILTILNVNGHNGYGTVPITSLIIFCHYLEPSEWTSNDYCGPAIFWKNLPKIFLGVEPGWPTADEKIKKSSYMTFFVITLRIGPFWNIFKNFPNTNFFGSSTKFWGSFLRFWPFLT